MTTTRSTVIDFSITISDPSPQGPIRDADGEPMLPQEGSAFTSHHDGAMAPSSAFSANERHMHQNTLPSLVDSPLRRPIPCSFNANESSHKHFMNGFIQALGSDMRQKAIPNVFTVTIMLSAHWLASDAVHVVVLWIVKVGSPNVEPYTTIKRLVGQA